ncbi:hypothetical protein Lalb_Chr06g0171631 [Lupinus albus]|uniref:Uncharacterized protein n=1 Tax=Lupinus albus TaxID=3870 RepID=A0A6A4QFH9_LUPAL|nr:hypothetical protein Lalb_Chr06g0171631 [Lupinus albus]
MYLFWITLSHRGYKCLSSKGKIVISTDVFNEYNFPYASTIKSPYSPSSSQSTHSLEQFLVFTILLTFPHTLLQVVLLHFLLPSLFRLLVLAQPLLFHM